MIAHKVKTNSSPKRRHSNDLFDPGTVQGSKGEAPLSRQLLPQIQVPNRCAISTSQPELLNMCVS